MQQCGVGLVRIKLDGAGAAFAAPPLTRAEVGAEELDAVLAALGTDRSRLVAAQFLNNGPNWLSLELDSAASVLAGAGVPSGPAAMSMVRGASPATNRAHISR